MFESFKKFSLSKVDQKTIVGGFDTRYCCDVYSANDTLSLIKSTPGRCEGEFINGVGYKKGPFYIYYQYVCSH